MTSHGPNEHPAVPNTIMVIDDNPIVRDILTLELTHAGYLVLTATDGADALRQLQNKRVELILLDINLPDVNGADLLPVIRQLPDAPGVIILTAHTALDPVVHSIAQDILGFLTKPCSYEELCESVSRGLGQLQAPGSQPDC